MPIYAYRCEQCGFEKDALQKVNDAPLSVCPSCGAPALRKKVSAPAFQLKGSGWYATDFRDSGKAKATPDSPHKDDAPTPAASTPGDSSNGTAAGEAAAKSVSADAKPEGKSSGAGTKPSPDPAR